MKLFIRNLYKQLHLFLLLKIFYRDKPLSFRYSSIIRQADLYHVKRLLNTRTCEYQLTTSQTITFKDLVLDMPMDDLIRALGTPYFITTKHFKQTKQTLVIYRDKINEFNVQAMINSLNNIPVNCTYHIEIESHEKLVRLKSILQERYQLTTIYPDEFIITDPLGNELHFQHIFNTTITYTSGNKLAKEKINYLINNILDEGLPIKSKGSEKLKYSF